MMIKYVTRCGARHDGLCPACKKEGIETELVNIHNSRYAACPRVLGHAKLVGRFSARERRLMRLTRLPRAVKTGNRHGRKHLFTLSGCEGLWVLDSDGQIAARETKYGLVTASFSRVLEAVE